LTDSYPAEATFTSPSELIEIEQAANQWRWQLKDKSHRMRRVHGDFHPFNILFDDEGEFYVLDRSRGAWGEPADDASCLSINYIFFSLQSHGELTGPFKELHSLFWNTYFDLREDAELLAIIQPWLAWRALVLACPVWYPDLQNQVRRRLLNMARGVMSEERYRPAAVNDYLEAR
jgi:aminoglycoside phosphotransferase (APT) family kinase protein